MSDELRLSQIVTTFGPGALVDLPRHSVIIAGLDEWPLGQKDAMQRIDEPRLREILERAMKENGRLAPDATLSLYQPPVKDDFASGRSPAIDARIFPHWFVCEARSEEPEAAPRRLVHISEIDPKRLTYDDGNRKLSVSPIRFVAACARGHIQDVEWRRLVHADGASCQEPMWLVDRGTTGDPRNLSIRCGCGRKLELLPLYAPGRLGPCRGAQPWLGPGRREDGCHERLRLLTRGAVNAYYPQTLRLISLPDEEDELTSAVKESMDVLAKVKEAEHLEYVFLGSPVLEARFSGYTRQEIFDRVQFVKQAREDRGAYDNNQQDPRYEEFKILASRRDRIGSPELGARLYAETLEDHWRRHERPSDGLIARLVRVPRLREVTALFGFTRLDPPAGAFDDGQDDFQLEVDKAPLAEHTAWLPAIEQYGEGVFVELDVGAVLNAISGSDLAARDRETRRRYEQWARIKGLKDARYRGGVYVFAHTLAHILLQEVALECGYPGTALRERVYAIRGAEGRGADITDAGILIYASGSGSQGTLGGLAEMTEEVPRLMERGLSKISLCSNDPICASREPSLSADATQINGSACHCCVFLPETSCENRNMLLDRQYLAASICSKPV